jgi:hypothetical protein
MAELNARLADPAPLDIADSRRMGLAVVARLAARHGLDVTLQLPSAGEGLVAVVQVPGRLVVVEAETSDLPVSRRVVPRLLERPALPGGEPVDVPHPRSTLVPVVPGHIHTPDGPTVDAGADAVRELLTGYQKALTNTEGRPSA